jgi:hypothetical protein
MKGTPSILFAAVAAITITSAQGQQFTLKTPTEFNDWLANARTISQYLDAGGKIDTVMSALPPEQQHFIKGYFAGYIKPELFKNDAGKGWLFGTELYIGAISGSKEGPQWIHNHTPLCDNGHQCLQFGK